MNQWNGLLIHTCSNPPLYRFQLILLLKSNKEGAWMLVNLLLSGLQLLYLIANRYKKRLHFRSFFGVYIFEHEIRVI